MRLIDADVLIAEYDRVHVGEPGGARKLMENAPTVDAVPVVRCKDCKYVSVEPCKDYEDVYVCNRNYWTRAQGGNMPTHFCSYGERRNSGEN